MRRRVTDGTMPPWHADVAAGAPEGDLKDLPPAPTFAEGWSIGTPDAMVQMTEDYVVPATVAPRPLERTRDTDTGGSIRSGIDPVCLRPVSTTDYRLTSPT
jgi:hypothetical protein